MKKEEIKAIITKTAEKYGFITEERKGYRWMALIEPASHYLNFMIDDAYPEDTDWTKEEIVTEMRIYVSLANTSTTYDPDEMLKAADILRNAGLMVKELDAMHLTCTQKR